eukprot:1157259-Pelagomonas_calceolata.AAC.5
MVFIPVVACFPGSSPGSFGSSPAWCPYPEMSRATLAWCKPGQAQSEICTEANVFGSHSVVWHAKSYTCLEAKNAERQA